MSHRELNCRYLEIERTRVNLDFSVQYLKELVSSLNFGVQPSSKTQPYSQFAGKIKIEN